LEVGAEGGFKLDLRQDCDPGRQDRDPGKQKLKGAIRTETYRRHYCQQTPTAEVGKILFVEKRRERLHIGECRRT
jgi:hypothetical protein